MFLKHRVRPPEFIIVIQRETPGSLLCSAERLQLCLCHCRRCEGGWLTQLLLSKPLTDKETPYFCCCLWKSVHYIFPPLECKDTFHCFNLLLLPFSWAILEVIVGIGQVILSNWLPLLYYSFGCSSLARIRKCLLVELTGLFIVNGITEVLTIDYSFSTSSSMLQNVKNKNKTEGVSSKMSQLFTHWSWESEWQFFLRCRSTLFCMSKTD